MSRVFADDGMMTWEAFTSTGPFGLPEQAVIVFQCLSDPNRRARIVEHGGDAAGAQRVVRELPESALRSLLEGSRELS